MLEVRGIDKSYTADQSVLNRIDLAVARGEIVCLLGPSGCGKTTLLRVIAGLEQPDRGEVWCEGQNLSATPVHKRNFGFMFQDFALFPHRNVAENIAFGLRMMGQPRSQIAARVSEMLDLVNLPGYDKRTIFELSGGERQRVALARSLAPNPRLLMLDEPLGSLDRVLRQELMGELRQILKRVGQTVIFVTHDQQEALAMADRVAVMNQGRIEQIATPQRLYQQPASPFVARFLGFHNLLPAKFLPGEPTRVSTSIGDFTVKVDPLGVHSLGATPTLLIFPDAAIIHDPEHPLPNVPLLGVAVKNLSFRGNYTLVEVTARLPAVAQSLRFELATTRPLAVGEILHLQILPERLVLL